MAGLWSFRGASDVRSTRWSGGTTTQLAIAPEGADYGRRDFLWRVSSAVVELEESDFTPLPDYRRLIATLEGEISLRHNGGESLRLRPFAVHAFDGADATRCVGRCRDFNLMLRKGAAEGEMEALILGDGAWTLAGDSRDGEQLLFCSRGVCQAESGEDRAELTPGASLLTACGRTLRLRAGAGGAVLMRCRMRLLTAGKN